MSIMTKRCRTTQFTALSAFLLLASVAMPAFAESTGQYIDDAAITAKVKEAIFADSQLKVLQVNVDSSHGTVLLSGVVDNPGQESEAVKVASKIDGVVTVTDNLSIKGM
jgi:osmotically-inducible protein OsmY